MTTDQDYKPTACPFDFIIPPDEFRPVTYPGVMSDMYIVSESGVVINKIRNFECGQSSNRGYLQVSLKQTDGSWRTMVVHRLVAWEFVPYRRDIELQVNHKDGNKLNNEHWNLEWVMPSENTQHAWNLGLNKPRKGDDSNYHILTSEDVSLICQKLQDPNITYKDVATLLGNKVSISCIQAIANGYNWTHISSKYSIPSRDQIICSKGSENYSAKLTDEDVHYICNRLLNPWISYVDIAEEIDYKVEPSIICRIANGKIWKHIVQQYQIPKRRKTK